MSSSPAKPQAPTESGLAAAIDLGTNTFHLLVGRLRDGGIAEVARERIFVQVAAEGIETIGAAPFARAVAAAERIGARLQTFGRIPVAIFGTAALRTASNGADLRAALEGALGHPVAVIDGQREAALIARGVLASGLPPAPVYLIMDIGGGSVEFVVVTATGERVFAESYPIGAQVLRRGFHTVEPFDAAQEARLRAHVSAQVAPVFEACAGREVQLVGASGTFDILAELYGRPVSAAVSQVSSEAVRSLFREARAMTAAERFADPRIPDDRAEMIVVALALIDVVLEGLPAGSRERIVTSGYALKEGAILELLTARVG